MILCSTEDTVTKQKFLLHHAGYDDLANQCKHAATFFPYTSTPSLRLPPLPTVTGVTVNADLSRFRIGNGPGVPVTPVITIGGTTGSPDVWFIINRQEVR